ncbi:germinal-center associated nuclear protein [Narcine bancroftii]|uniref:germinal-center associated nuclear protein n=1 Tax=Narcine bancroftii TaxID=1343680 RepID=UPI003831D9A7
MDPTGKRLPALFAPHQAAVFGQASEAAPPPAAFGHPVAGAASSVLPAGYVRGPGSAPPPSQIFSFRHLNPFPGPVNFGAAPVGNFGHPEPIFSSFGNPDVQRPRGAGLDTSKAVNKLPSFQFLQSASSGGEAGVFSAPQSKAGPSGPVFSFSQAISSPSSSFFGLPRPKATTSLPNASNFSQPTAMGSSAESFRFVQPAPSGNRSSTPFTFSQPSTAGSVDVSALTKTLGSEEKTGQKPGFGVSDVSSLSAFDVKRRAIGAGTSARSGLVPNYEAEEEQLTAKKGIKRKDKSPYSAAKDQAMGTASRPSLGKRLVKVAPSMGVFHRTLHDVLKGRREVKRNSTPSEDATIERLKLLSQTSIPLAWPYARKEETRKKLREDFSGKPFSRRLRRGDSTDSLSGTPVAELTAIQCKNIPADLNKKEIIRKHFSQFGKVQRVYCQTNKNLAVVHFNNHVSASNAKKRGKFLCKQNIEIFWQRKKNSPGKKSSWEETKKPKVDEKKPTMDKPSTEGSSLHNPAVKPPVAGNTANRSPLKNAPSKSQKPESESHLLEVDDQVPASERIGTLPSSLSHLIGIIAVNPEEKYRVLDQRDKLMRQAQVKRTDLEKAKAVVGTCMDLCPEKERYMRETRYQLSPFEIIPGTDKVNHEAAIKEYSRSSADQEEPLPHELRPAPVLKLTMDYLVTKIMDQGEENYRDWYDFVWNRTRGVRKDITQQHLCDKLTVALIEKCTRFHIHCSHHLCEEPMSSYDAKINDENLTKCLQSLKEMYQDLATKNTYCENEAEFRSYHVLLNLNEGDILREVQQFRPIIRNSPEVKLAVRAFAALNSNNFVRFFKVVKVSSYLSACILHRYFKQVRREALKALNFALTVSSQRSTMFPMDILVRMLQFKDYGEAAEFARDYGLNVSDWCVELNRLTLCDPDFVLLPKRSSLIDEKRITLIGEIVNGGPLPLFKTHVPVLSFDSQGRYIGEFFEPSNVGQKLTPRALPVKDQAPAQEILPIKQPPPLLQTVTSPPASLSGPAQEILPIKQPPPLLQTATSPPASLSAPTPEILPVKQPPPLLQILTSPPASLSAPTQEILPVKQPPPPPLLQTVTSPPSSLSGVLEMPSEPPPKLQPPYPEKMIVDVVKDVIRDLVKDVLRVECKEVARAGAAFAAEAFSMSSESTEELIGEVTTEMLKEASTEEVQAEKKRIEDEKRRIEQARLKQEWELWKSRYSRALCDELMDQVVEYSVRKCATRELRLAVEEDRRARINRCSTELCNHLIKETLESEIFQAVKETLQEAHCFCKYLKKWRATAEARKRLRKQMRMFPAAPGSAGSGYKLSPQKMGPEQPPDDNLGISCIRLLERRKEIAHQIRVQNFYQQLLGQAAWAPLDLFTLVVESFPIRQKRMFWKVVLLLPSDEECGPGDTNRTLSNWLKAKFQGNECVEDLGSDADNVIQTHQCKAVSRFEANDEHVYICVKVTKGPLSDTDVDVVEQRKELLGTTALILLLPPCIKGLDQDEEEVYWLSAMLQVRQLLQAKPLNPAIPLVVLVPREGKSLNEEEVIDGLKLEALVATHLVSEFFIVQIPEKTNDLHGSSKVSEAVRWLASHCPSPPEVCCQTLMQFIEDGLCREFSDQFYRDKSERHAATLPCQDPSSVIELYNDVLRFLAEVVSSEQLYNLSWPAAEFCGPVANEMLAHPEWNSSSHLTWLKNALLSFQLPLLDLPPLQAPWPKVCDMIFHYVSQVPWSQQACPLLLSKVERLLSRIRDKWRENCFLMLEPSEDEGPAVQEIPWDDIVACCIDHRLREWKPLSQPCVKEAMSEDAQILVYYFKDDLKKYKPPTVWQEARSHTQMEIQDASDRLSQRQACTLIKQKFDLKSYAVEVSSEETIPEKSLDITHTYSAEELLPERLRLGLESEREENRRCEEQLNRWLDEGPLEPIALPLYLPQSLASVAELVPKFQASAPTSPQEVDDNEQHEDSDMNDSAWVHDSSMTLSDKLKEFTRLIQASQEEEMTCERHLSILLDLTDT